jgi:hypothetical protein
VPWSDEKYVRYWNGSAAVGRFMQARQSSSQEIWVVLEHVPHQLMVWLSENQERVGEVLAQLFQIVATLGSMGVVHFDAHFGNVVTDGPQCRLTDFGLVMARDFELGVREQRFLAAHRHYDYGIVLSCLGIMLARSLGGEMQLSLRDAMDAVDQLPLDPVPLQPSFPRGMRQHDGEAARSRRLLGAANHLRVKRVRDVRDDHGEAAGAVTNESLALLERVADLAGRGENPLRSAGVHPAGSRYRPGDRRGGHPSDPRDVVYRRAAFHPATLGSVGETRHLRTRPVLINAHDNPLHDRSRWPHQADRLANLGDAPGSGPWEHEPQALWPDSRP